LCWPAQRREWAPQSRDRRRHWGVGPAPEDSNIHQINSTRRGLTVADIIQIVGGTVGFLDMMPTAVHAATLRANLEEGFKGGSTYIPPPG
jgi:hypothetical protein